VAEKIEQLRAIGALVCKFANAGCLCQERDRPLCRNVMARSEEIYAVCFPPPPPKMAAAPKSKRRAR